MILSALQISATGAGAASKTTLTIGMIEPIDSLNPFIGINDNAYIFYGLVYDYLIAVDGDMKPKPNLATSWYIVPDQLPYGSVWQYNLTHNATWHDGEPFTAEDVNFTFNYQIGPNVESMWAYQPYTKLIQWVQEMDQYTVRIHFMSMNSPVPAPCTFGDAIMVPIIPRHIWKDISTSAAGFNYTNYMPIGTGPFKCSADTKKQFLAGDRLILDKNPNYHGYKDYGQQVRYDRIVLEWYLEPSAMVADMQRGAIDLAKFDAPQYENLMNWLAGNPDAPIGHYAGLQCTGFSAELGICMAESGGTTNNLRLDPAVRKAMALATDKQFITDHIYKGYSEGGSGLLTPMYKNWWWGPSTTEMTSVDQWGPQHGLAIPYSLEMANETLQAAGYHWNEGKTIRNASHTNPWNPDAPLKFDLIVESELPEDREVGTFLAEEYKKIGIELNLVFMGSTQWNTVIYTYSYDMTITYWSGDPDPNYLLYVQSSYSLDGWSDNYYSSYYYDENYSDSVATLDAAKRLADAKNCQMLTYYDAAYIVYAYAYGCYAWNTAHYEGWDDWGAHPGRSFSNFYTANDLWFDLNPIGKESNTSGLMTYVAIGTVVIIVAAAVVTLLLRRRGGGMLKEDDVRLP